MSARGEFQGATPSPRFRVTPKAKAAGLTLLAVLLWGFAPIGTRYMVGVHQAGIPALPFVGLRYFIAALFYLPILFGSPRKWSRQDLFFGALCGLIGVTGYNLPNALGQRTVSAGMTGLLNGAEPLMIVVISALRYRRVPTVWTILASLIGLSGIVLLARGAGPAEGDVKGITLVLVSALAWSVYCVMVLPLIQRRGAVAVTAVAMASGSLPMLLAGSPGIPGVVEVLSISQWEVLMALVIGTSVIAILCWNAGSAGLGAEQAAWFLYLLPVVSLIGGAVILHEPLTMVEFFGGGLIMLSVFLSQRMGRS